MFPLRDVLLRRGPEPLLEQATFSILRGEKVGIVGRNGSGKSSLLALIQGTLSADRGEFECPPQLRIATVAQELPHSERPVIEHVIDGDQSLRDCERRLSEAEARNDGVAQAEALLQFDLHGGYTARSRAAALLDGLGFDAHRVDEPIAAFSGGLRMRANLARALMCPSDLLLLDEPTNHLDLDAVLWLERWLQEYPGTLLLVSHDRDFMDAIVGRIIHLSAARTTAYTGNFSRFEQQRAARAAQQQAANEKLRREADHVRSFIDRFRAKASKARQAQSRIKWLERLPDIVVQRDEAAYEWRFAEPRKLPTPLIALDRVDTGYAARRILRNVSLSIAPGARIGILGRNGAGKSTLIKTLAGELVPLAGSCTSAADLATGFFAQLEVDQLDAESSALLELNRRGGEIVSAWSPQQQRDHLGQFGFRGDRVFEPVRHFSGGERARLSLAILVARRPNLLLLDEPTNHLDLEMRDALLLSLQEFPGAVVLVSHDRGLLGGVCDEFLRVREGEVESFDGDLYDYARWLAATRRSAETVVPSPRTEPAATDRKERKRLEAEARNRLAPQRTELKRIERELETCIAERQALEARLADPALYASADPAARALPAAHAALLARIHALEERWLTLSEELGA
ncbi:MAG: ABC-F family ATP-binding cassette domain-containing protein [Nevskiaceae bacterium]